MLDLIQAQEALKDASDQRLLQEMQQPTGSLPPYLVLGEMKRRQDLRQQAQARQMQQQQGTVAQDLTMQTVAANAPMGAPMQMAPGMPHGMPPGGQGMPPGARPQMPMPPQTMVPPRGMARGGIVEVDQSERMRGAVEKLRETARVAPDMLRRSDYLDRVAREYGLDPQEFREAIGAQPREMRAGGPVYANNGLALPAQRPLREMSDEDIIALLRGGPAPMDGSPLGFSRLGVSPSLMRRGANGYPQEILEGELARRQVYRERLSPEDAATAIRSGGETLPANPGRAPQPQFGDGGDAMQDLPPAPSMPPAVAPQMPPSDGPDAGSMASEGSLYDNQGNPILPPIPPASPVRAAPSVAARAASAAEIPPPPPDAPPIPGQGSPATEAGQRLDRYDQLLKAIGRRQEGADERQAEARDMALLQMGLRMMGSPQPLGRAISEAGVPALASMQQARSEARRDQREAMRDELDVEKLRTERDYRREDRESRERIAEADRTSAEGRAAAAIAAGREGRITPEMYMSADPDTRAIYDRFLGRSRELSFEEFRALPPDQQEQYMRYRRPTDPLAQELQAQRLELQRQQAAARVEADIQRRQLEFAQNNGFTPNLSPEQLARMSSQGRERYEALRRQYDAIGAEARRALQSGTTAAPPASAAGQPPPGATVVPLFPGR